MHGVREHYWGSHAKSPQKITGWLPEIQRINRMAVNCKKWNNIFSHIIIPLKLNIFLHICISFDSLVISDMLLLQVRFIYITFLYKLCMFCLKSPQIRFQIYLWIKFERASWAKYPTKSPQNSPKPVFSSRTPPNIYINPKMILLIMWSPWQPEWCWVTPTPEMDILQGNVRSHTFAFNQPRLSIVACISMLIAPMSILGPFCSFVSRI